MFFFKGQYQLYKNNLYTLFFVFFLLLSTNIFSNIAKAQSECAFSAIGDWQCPQGAGSGTGSTSTSTNAPNPFSGSTPFFFPGFSGSGSMSLTEFDTQMALLSVVYDNLTPDLQNCMVQAVNSMDITDMTATELAEIGINMTTLQGALNALPTEVTCPDGTTMANDGMNYMTQSIVNEVCNNNIDSLVDGTIDIITATADSVAETTDLLCSGGSVPTASPLPTTGGFQGEPPPSCLTDGVGGWTVENSMRAKELEDGAGQNYSGQTRPPAGSGYCAQGVKRILHAQGFLSSYPSGNGHDMAGVFEGLGWEKLDVPPDQAPPGCVLTFDSYKRSGAGPVTNSGGHLYGHVEIVIVDDQGRRGYISDKTRTNWGGTVPKAYTGCYFPPGGGGTSSGSTSDYACSAQASGVDGSYTPIGAQAGSLPSGGGGLFGSILSIGSALFSGGSAILSGGAISSDILSTATLNPSALLSTSGLSTSLMSTVSSLSTNALNSLTTMGTSLLSNITSIGTDLIGNIANLDLSALTDISNFAPDLMAKIQNFSPEIFSQIANFDLSVLNDLTSLAPELLETVKNISPELLNSIKDLDLSALTDLANLDIADLQALTGLDVNSLINIKDLGLDKLLDLQNLPLNLDDILSSLDLDQLQDLANLDLSEIANLKDLGLDALTDLSNLTDISKLIDLEGLSDTLLADIKNLGDQALQAISGLEDISDLAEMINLPTDVLDKLTGLDPSGLISSVTGLQLDDISDKLLDQMDALSDTGLQGMIDQMTNLDLMEVVNFEQFISTDLFENAIEGIESFVKTDIDGLIDNAKGLLDTGNGLISSIENTIESAIGNGIQSVIDDGLGLIDGLDANIQNALETNVVQRIGLAVNQIASIEIEKTIMNQIDSIASEAGGLGNTLKNQILDDIESQASGVVESLVKQAIIDTLPENLSVDAVNEIVSQVQSVVNGNIRQLAEDTVIDQLQTQINNAVDGTNWDDTREWEIDRFMGEEVGRVEILPDYDDD